MMSPKICLNMIVKNEAHVIERCLRSIKPFIHSWLICDTGSTDDTLAIIRRMLGDLPGVLLQRPWVDFATNRNEALANAAAHAEYGDYALIIDADDTLEADPGFQWPVMTDDGYMLEIVDAGNTRYQRLALPRLTPGLWSWKGVLHEYLTTGGPYQAYPRIQGVRILRLHNDGARSQLPQKEKFLNDAEILRQGLLKEPRNERYVFYLAQSYRDAGDLKNAIRTYERRVLMGGWSEEVYFSKLQIAKLTEQLSYSWRGVAGKYLDAYSYRPTRAEAPCELARYARLDDRFALGRDFGRIATLIESTNDVLFLDQSVYDWRSKDEWSISSYWCGEFAISRRLCLQLLKSPKLPKSERERVQKNLEFANSKLKRK